MTEIIEKNLKPLVLVKLSNEKLKIVHKSWLADHLKKVNIPSVSSDTLQQSLAFDAASPAPSWNEFEVGKIIGHSSKPGKIKKCLSQASHGSDINSEFEFHKEEDLQLPPKKKRKKSAVTLNDDGNIWSAFKTDSNHDSNNNVSFYDNDDVLEAALKNYDNQVNSVGFEIIIPYLKDIQENQRRIMMEVERCQKLVSEEIASLRRLPPIESTFIGKMKERLPLTIDSIENFDSDLNDESKPLKYEFREYIKSLTTTYKNGKDRLRAIFQHIYDPKIARDYNYYGHKKKKPLNALTSAKMIIDIVHAEATGSKLDEIIFAAREWLRSKGSNTK